jgi:protein involved in polysaccharide export with SLBB domain
MTVSQAIEYAGGLKPSVFPVAYIVRKDVSNPDKMQYIRINLDTDGDQFLQPGDQLNVYDNTTYTNVGEVRVSGAVKTPMGTTYDESLTVHDLLSMAGGFAVGAAYDRVQVFRVNISDSKAAELECIQIKVDENYNPVGGEFQLQPYDHIVVRMTPDFTTGRSIELNGRVKYPGTYVLTDSKTQLWEIIEMAGGLLDDADPYARLFRTYNNRGNIGLNLRKVKWNHGSLRHDPILMEGDVINIVRRENTITIRETGTLMAQYVPSEYLSSTKTIIYQGPHTADWYIRNFAGGFQKTADKNSVTVTMPNSQMIGTTRILGIRQYPTVEPGGVITMKIDTEKQEKLEKPKEKIDWGAELRSTLSALTSVVSIILLIDRLK